LRISKHFSRIAQAGLALGGLFQFGELGTFLGALPAGFAATGKRFDLSLLVAGFGELFAGACTDIAK